MMSSMSITNRRQIWSNQHPLRKQRSLIDNNNVGGYLTNSTNNINNININNNNNTIINGNLLNSQRNTKFSLLQKQFSVDKIYNSRYNHSNNNNNNNGRSLTRQDHHHHNYNQQGRYVSANNNNRIINGFNKNRTNSSSSCSGQLTLNNNKDTTELSVYLTSKKKTVQIGYGDKKERNIVSDRLSRKSTKTGDDKVNLNIFLGHSVTETSEYDDGSSDDVDISTENPTEIIQSKNSRPKTPEKISTSSQPTAIITTTTITKPIIRKPLSAASRRAQFQANRDNSINLSTTSIISAAPSLTISSRPPLVRAMSAPIRTLDENSKYILANKRKSRRRKILGRQSTCDRTSPTNTSLINNNNNNNNISNNNNNVGDENNNENINDKNRINKPNNNKSFNRTRPELGCDVVTLVSLISSEGSDSEKEEILPVKIVTSPVKRAPTLRKTGKSVSFQEHDIPNFTTATKEFPHMLRRGSVAPLAARIRANRPPTAPPVSIFIADFENSHTKMSEKIKSSSKEDLSTTKTLLTNENNSKDCQDDDNSSSDNNQFPEYARTIKERECWKLFQKMSNKGVSVSYDTILRGMLTPTELRHLQKQREHEEALKAKQQQKQDEAAAQ